MATYEELENTAENFIASVLESGYEMSIVDELIENAQIKYNEEND